MPSLAVTTITWIFDFRISMCSLFLSLILSLLFSLSSFPAPYPLHISHLLKVYFELFNQSTLILINKEKVPP